MKDDVRFAIRLLVAHPGFAAVAVLTLALGIAANAAIFSVVHGVLLRPLPYADGDRIVAVWTYDGKDFDTGHSAGDYKLIRDGQRAFSHLAGSRINAFTVMSAADTPISTAGAWVTNEFFEVFPMTPIAGRVFSPATDANVTDAPVVISEKTWRDGFGASPAIVGQRIKIDGEMHTVVGVMPAAFQWPGEAELWLLSPRAVPPSPIPIEENDRKVRFFQLTGRLAPGVTMAMAQQELDRMTVELRKDAPPQSRDLRLTGKGLEETIVGDVRPAILILQAGVLIVLLVACANVSSLLIARTTSRARELAIRAALGAGRGRLIRQLLTESLVIGLSGGLIGLLAGRWLISLLLKMLPDAVPRAQEISLDVTVVSATIVAALGAGVLFAAMPALHAGRTRAAAALKGGGERGSTSAGRSTSRAALVIAEIALTLVLCVTAGLLLNSFLRLQRVDSGFVGEHLLVAGFSLPDAKYGKTDEMVRYFDRLQASLAGRAEFQASGFGFPAPFHGDNVSGNFDVEGYAPPDGGGRPTGNLATVSSGYFTSMGMKIEAGRSFSAGDRPDAPGVAIVTRAMANRYWKDGDAIGRRVKFESDPKSPWITIVGIASDVRQLGLKNAPTPILFIPYAQFPLPFASISVRSQAPAAAAQAALRAAMAAVDPEIPLGDIRTLDEMIGFQVAEPRFRSFVIASFAIVTLVLAAVGLYGLISFSVSQQTREIGIRIALGAAPAQVVGPMLRRGLALAAGGVAIGICGAIIASRVVAQFLFGVTATDPLTIVGVSTLLVVVAMIATWIPSRRALRVDPIVALRAE